MSYIRYKTPDNYISTYNPVVGFSDAVRVKVNSFIEDRVEKLFESLSLDIEEAEFIELHETITDKEFQNTSAELANSYFYQYIFTNTKKKADGSISEPIKFCITFDRDLTPLSIDSISYGTIKIANRPVLYYILFDLRELIKVSKL